jgi:manganese/zinc/iron transport system permease protein
VTWSLTLQTVALGAILLGATGGAVGSFALLRRQSLLGDALAHAALPGICLAFLLSGGERGPFTLLTGALVAGLCGAVVIALITGSSRIKEDAAIGIVLSVFFGIGVVLLTYIQQLPLGQQSGLDKFLFGQAAAMLPRDVILIAVLAGVTAIALALAFKELRLLAFDRAFGKAIGFPMRRIELLLTVLLVAVIVVGLQMVGVVLVIATLISPAAAARQWTDRLGVMILIASLVGALSGGAGAVTSALVPRLPTGPCIVLILSAVLLASVLLAPRRGLLWALVDRWIASARIQRENLLKELYRTAEHDQRWEAHRALADLADRSGLSRPKARAIAGRLARSGHLDVDGSGAALTDSGRRIAANVIRKHRLWESYLSRRLELADELTHENAEVVEHALTDDTADAIARLLDHPRLDPQGKPIPARESRA